ncbi:beta-ketoacyl synthase N-terminal-like domain-containing protein [Aquimarina macrocephali]|uniref:beta-ketoacyl synthase N-terminal-like domain-containing protein n=1 Tax=Aquimarina macrocephali TaxID=666563 RepID=UPI00046643B8|nr:beta-ketoacyl synthase N-terminal-like domain-containing protein [Aquimarina macrocephali]
MIVTTNKVGITGMGTVSSVGNGVSTFSNSLRYGESGIKQIPTIKEPKISVDIAAKIEDFSFSDSIDRFQNVSEEKYHHAKRLGRRAPFVIQTSIISALEAWFSARLQDNKPLPERIGLIVAGQNSTQNYQYDLISKFRKNPEYLSPRYALEFLETNQIGVLSELFGIEGEGFAVGGASATGNVGIIKGYQLVHSGLVDVCLVTGVVADLSPMDIQGFINIGAMGGKKYIDQPEKSCRPFDAQHEGFIYGQASASVILESEISATKRGIPFLAEVKGYGLNLDSNSSANPNVNGEAKAMLSALNQAGLSVSDVDYINTHGSSSPLGDKTEAEAISKVFKDHTSDLWLNSTKGLTGHCLYSAGIVETIATVEQMRQGFLHPNKNLETPICNDLQFCGTAAVDYQVDVAMSNSFGFGGINTSIVLKRR